MTKTFNVPLMGNLRKSVTVNPAATEGAQIGVNLLMPDGSVGSVAQLQKLFGVSASTGSDIGTTDDLEEGQWNLWFTNHRVYLASKAQLKTSSNVTITTDDGADTLTFDLADLTDSGTGSLLATTFDAKGRKTGSRDATITGTDGHIAVSNGNAVAGPPVIDLDARLAALIDFLKAVAPNPRVTSDGSYRVTADGAYRVTA